MREITPNLWINDGKIEEAVEFYCSVFDDGRIITKSHYPEGTASAGSVLTVEWEVRGMRFLGLNGGPQFKFNEAVSFVVTCKDQDEVDYYWDKLREGGGEESQCGWLKDRYGLSWQVVPTGMEEMLKDAESPGAKRAMNAMLQMRKIDLAELRRAHAGVG
jgi:predicted 3-demethylubiquinone-9 3-methyltransferase (glyoxalase superfamily)